MTGRWKLLDHHHHYGKQSNMGAVAVERRGVLCYETNNSAHPLPLCRSQGFDLWLIHRLSQSGGTKEDFGQRSEWAAVNEKSDWSLSQQDHSVTPSVLLSNVHLNRLTLTMASKLLVSSLPLSYFGQLNTDTSFCSCCSKCFFMISIRKKSKQTALTSVISVHGSQCVCGGWMDDWGSLAGSLPLANMLHHCELRQTDVGGGGGDGVVTHLDAALQGYTDSGCLLNKASK